MAAAGADQVSTRELLAIAEATRAASGHRTSPASGSWGTRSPSCAASTGSPRSWPPAATPVIGALCPPEDRYRAEQHLVEEIQVAARVGPGIAHRDITAAGLLAGPLARSHADLATGWISDAHVRVLIFETRNVVDDPTAHPDLTGAIEQPVGPGRTREGKLTAIQDWVAAAARRQTPSQFRVTVRAAICAVDAAGEADRRAAAKTTPRRVRGPGHGRHQRAHRP